MVESAGGSRRTTLLLAAGAGLGVVLAAVGLIARGAPRGALQANAVAQVNDEVIRLDEYQRVLGALAQDKRDALDDAQRQRVLDRLIDEELLVQRGIALGMTRSDSKVRKDLTGAVIDSVVAAAADAQPSDAELRAFYEAHQDFFAGPGRVRVRQVFFRAPTNADAPMALERAQEAARRLRAGEDFATVRGAVGDPELAPLPDAPLPLAKLVDYLGPTASRVAVSLDEGAVSEPVRSSTGLHVLQVLERQPDRSPPLEEIKPHVVAEFRRRAGEQALRTYLDELRAHATIAVTAQLP